MTHRTAATERIALQGSGRLASGSRNSGKSNFFGVLLNALEGPAPAKQPEVVPAGAGEV